jgi:hypothetical protein
VNKFVERCLYLPFIALSGVTKLLDFFFPGPGLNYRVYEPQREISASSFSGISIPLHNLEAYKVLGPIGMEILARLQEVHGVKGVSIGKHFLSVQIEKYCDPQEIDGKVEVIIAEVLAIPGINDAHKHAKLAIEQEQEKRMIGISLAFPNVSANYCKVPFAGYTVNQAIRARSHGIPEESKRKCFIFGKPVTEDYVLKGGDELSVESA